MVRIHGLVYLIVGIGVVIPSRFVDGLQPFFYVGIVFIAIGVAKLVWRYITREKTPKMQSYKPMQQRRTQAPYQQQPVYRCPRCGSQSGALFNFCSQCGVRLR